MPANSIYPPHLVDLVAKAQMNFPTLDLNGDGQVTLQEMQSVKESLGEDLGFEPMEDPFKLTFEVCPTEQMDRQYAVSRC